MMVKPDYRSSHAAWRIAEEAFPIEQRPATKEAWAKFFEDIKQ